MIAFPERRRITIAVVATIVTICLLLVLQTSTYEDIRARTGRVLSSAGYGSEVKSAPKEEQQEVYRVGTGYTNDVNYGHGEVSGNSEADDTREKLAYLTFLSGTVDQDDDLEKDNYFIAVRILVWQLVHNPSTRAQNIDVVVMVTPSVSESRRERLKKDGAILYPVEFLHTKNDAWIHAEQHRWDDVMTKIRAWEMTQYSRILMLDGDTMLRSPLDGVFDDPGAQILKTKQLDNVTIHEGEAPLPPTYLLGSLSEVWDSSHAFPPLPGTGLKTQGYMNAGFFMLAPSKEAFAYYRSLLDIPNIFDPKYPEQNLLNYAHRWDGPMPWTEVSYHWNIRCPNENDFAHGLVSMHEKWWKQPYLYENQPVKDFLKSRRWEMKGWYDAWDLRHAW